MSYGIFRRVLNPHFHFFCSSLSALSATVDIPGELVTELGSQAGDGSLQASTSTMHAESVVAPALYAAWDAAPEGDQRYLASYEAPTSERRERSIRSDSAF